MAPETITNNANATIETAQTATTPEPVYDATIRRTVLFDAFMNDEDRAVEVDIEPITDSIYRSTVEPKDRMRFSDGGTKMSSDVADGYAALFDAVVTDVRGLAGERPENWKEVLDVVQVKVPIVSQLLTVACYKESLSWNQGDSPVISEAYFGSDIVACKHFLRTKTTDDVRKYRSLQKMPINNRNKGLKESDVVIPTFSVLKAQLYDAMTTKPAEGYAAGVVPIWHKVAVVEFLFNAGLTAKN